MQKLTLIFGTAAVCLTAVQATAQMSPADQTFATKAAAGGKAEVSLGQFGDEERCFAASPSVWPANGDGSYRQTEGLDRCDPAAHHPRSGRLDRA